MAKTKKHYQYWFSWAYLKDEHLRIGDGSFFLNRKPKASDIKDLGEYVQASCGLDEAPVIVSFHRTR